VETRVSEHTDADPSPPAYRELVSDEFDVDRSESGDGLLEATQAELDEVALRRSATLGRPVVVTTFTGADTALVWDVDDAGELVETGAFVLEHPTPSLELDVIVDDD
jgi:hypothetical protein